MSEEIAGRPGDAASILAAQETAERLAGAIETHDPEVDRHLIRMASIAALLGAMLGLDAEQVMLLRAAAPMHDIGNIALPKCVLQMPGPLTSSERAQMEAHTTVGHAILAGSESEMLKTAATIALTHHEWLDGSGYPQGLGGDEIPIEGRIAAVADVLDALLSERRHRPAFAVDDAMKLIARESGSHFDSAVVDALTGNLDEALALRR